MTQIDFYTNVADKLSTACRLAQKGYTLGHKVIALCRDAESAQRFDRMLWTAPATGFTPHCDSADALASLTPIVIDYRNGEPVHDEVLMNLREECPPLFARFKRLIEIVSLDDEDKLLARTRYKFYRDRGYDIRVHDLSEAPAARP
jgi:DNA polymerase-3 subunit chi